ncbi:MAG: chromosomal replication initiator protein DnaA [Isosphaeraceae bacterium]
MRTRLNGSTRGGRTTTTTAAANATANATATRDLRTANPAAEGPAVDVSAVRAAVADRLGEAKFGLWFGDGVDLRVSGDGESLVVRVPDEFFRDWIRRHYAKNLSEAAESVAGRALRLSIEVRAPEEYVAPPAVDRPTSAPASPSPSPSGRRKASAESLAPAVEPNPATEKIAPEPKPAPERAATPRRAPRRLEDFVAGPGSRLALAAAREMALSAGAAFNPLVIHGGVGLGKTLLLDGIGHALRRAHPGLNVLQLTAESFTNGFLEAMRTGGLSAFRGRFRGAGALIVDDVHFLAAKRATQDEFLHTFNALYEKGAPIVLAADQHPRLISRLTDELVTRFLGGMVVKVEAPDVATRRAILQSRSSARGVDVPEAVIAYIAEHLRASVRELEGALHTVIAQAVLTGKRLDLNLAKAALRDTIRHTAQAVALRDVERAVCALFQVTADALKSDSRARALAYPRMMAMYLSRKHTGAAYSEIGRYFGGRNHSTVISAEKKVAAWLRDEERSSLLPGFETVADLLADLERSLGG